MALYEVTNDPAAPDFSADGTARTLQNVKNLLRCRKGEVPYDRARGFDAALFDLPLPQLQDALMEELDRLLLWEPDAGAESAEASLREDGTVRIRVFVEVE